MNFAKLSAQGVRSVKYDEGLRSFMLKMYHYMAIALAITGASAMFAASSEAFIQSMFGPTGGLTMFGWIITLSPIGLVFLFSAKIGEYSVQTSQVIFWSYSVLMGLSMAPIFLVYTEASIAKAFFVTASVFGAMSIYGQSTKRDLTSIGSFLMMGLIGVLVASLVNIFLKSPAFDFAISIISVLVFTGLTAYDSQQMKKLYHSIADHAGENEYSKLALVGALRLYMDFINLFIIFLKFFGERKD